MKWCLIASRIMGSLRVQWHALAISVVENQDDVSSALRRNQYELVENLHLLGSPKPLATPTSTQSRVESHEFQCVCSQINQAQSSLLFAFCFLRFALFAFPLHAMQLRRSCAAWQDVGSTQILSRRSNKQQQYSSLFLTASMQRRRTIIPLL